MEVTVRQEVLAHALAALAAVPDDKATHPMVGFTRMIAFAPGKDTESILQLAATNLQQVLETVIPGTVEHAGSLLVPTKQILRIVESLPSQQVTLRTIENKLSITALGIRRSHVLATRSSDDFPKMPDPPKDGVAHVFPTKLISEMVKRVDHVVGTRSPRHLEGVFLDYDGKSFWAVAFGLTQAAWFKKPTEVTEEPWKCLLPSCMLRALRAICVDSEKVTLKRDQNYVYAETPDTLLATVLPNEPYLEWYPALEGMDAVEVARVQVAALVTALQGVTCASSERTVKLQFSQNGELGISLMGEQDIRAAAVGCCLEASDVVSCDVLKPWECYSDAGVMLEHLKTIDRDEVTVSAAMPHYMKLTGDGYRGLVCLVDPPKALPAASAEGAPAVGGGRRRRSR